VRRLIVALALGLTVAACAEILPVGPAEAVAEATDDLFVFTVRSPANRYASGAPIVVGAELVYQGPKARETIYHASSPVGWQLAQLDGPAVMGGGMDEPCLNTDLERGAAQVVPFQKAGVVDDVGPFDRAWFEDRVLRLPAGRWRISAELGVALGDCGGEPHALEASIELLVTP